MESRFKELDYLLSVIYPLIGFDCRSRRGYLKNDTRSLILNAGRNSNLETTAGLQLISENAQLYLNGRS